jgi:hypothetical protein
VRILQRVSAQGRQSAAATGSAVAARLAELLEWPRGIARLGVASCVAIAIASVLVEWPQAIDRLHERASQQAALTFEDREFGAVGNSIVADPRALYEARELIPADGSFHVVTGSEPIEGATPLTLTGIESYATFFLLPRRPSNSARWVLCYGCEITALGSRARIVWTNGAGISIVRRSG